MRDVWPARGWVLSRWGADRELSAGGENGVPAAALGGDHTAPGRTALGRTAPGRTVSETGGGGQVGCSSRGLLRWYAHWKRSAAWFSSEPGIGHRRKGLIVAWSLVRTHHSARTSASLRPPGFDDGQR